MELLKRTEEDSKETFIAYGKRTHAVSMLYLNENLTIDMVNLSTGEEKKVNARKKRKRGRTDEIFNLCPDQGTPGK